MIIVMFNAGMLVLRKHRVRRFTLFNILKVTSYNTAKKTTYFTNERFYFSIIHKK